MTDPVDRVRAARETDRRAGGERTLKGEKPKRHADGVGNDSVDISPEARERATGKESGG